MLISHEKTVCLLSKYIHEYTESFQLDSNDIYSMTTQHKAWKIFCLKTETFLNDSEMRMGKENEIMNKYMYSVGSVANS